MFSYHNRIRSLTTVEYVLLQQENMFSYHNRTRSLAKPGGLVNASPANYPAGNRTKRSARQPTTY